MKIYFNYFRNKPYFKIPVLDQGAVNKQIKISKLTIAVDSPNRE